MHKDATAAETGPQIGRRRVLQLGALGATAFVLPQTLGRGVSTAQAAAATGSQVALAPGVAGQISTTGWNTWDIEYHTGVVHLPSGIEVHFGLYDPTTDSYFDGFTWHVGFSSLGPHATDGSYSSVDVNWANGVLTTVPGAALSPPSQQGSGLYGEYFTNETLAGDPATTEVDPDIDFQWGGDSPAPGVPGTSWSARWTGFLTADQTGTYTLALTSDDGSRLYVGDTLVIDNWNIQGATTMSAQVPLTAGDPVPIRIEYFQNQFGSLLTFGWAEPGQPYETVITCEYAAPDENTSVCRITPQAVANEAQLVVVMDGAWGSPVQASSDGNTLTGVTSDGTFVTQTSPATVPTAPSLSKLVALAVPLDGPVLVVTVPDSQSSGSVDPVWAGNVVDQLSAADAASRLSTSGWLQDAADGLVRAITWNTVWNPPSSQIVTPVSRDFFSNRSRPVVFEWDNFFCSMMSMAIDRNLSEANFTVILDNLTAEGFVPNYEWPGQQSMSDDRSEPPVGAYCLLKAYMASGLGSSTADTTLLAWAYPLLLGYHDWWFTARDGNNDGLLNWGSSPVPGEDDANLQAACYESGLDNSPMYDDAVFNTTTNTMNLDDVGLNSLYAADAWALSQIATILGITDDAQRLEAEYEAMGQKINSMLWNEDAGIYQNLFWDGTFSTELSPTLFYPLIAGIVPPRPRREHGQQPPAQPGRVPAAVHAALHRAERPGLPRAELLARTGLGPDELPRRRRPAPLRSLLGPRHPCRERPEPLPR